MQEVFSKIIEKLEDKRNIAEQLIMKNPHDEIDRIQTQTAEDFVSAYNDAIEIVKQEAEQCKSIYMDGEYCWQSCWCTDRCGECNRLCNGDIDYYESYDERNNGWISCSERLPEPIRPVLVTLRNWMNDKYIVRVGRFHTDHWKTDEGIVENSIVIAWQPLPQPYQPKGE